MRPNLGLFGPLGNEFSRIKLGHCVRAHLANIFGRKCLCGIIVNQSPVIFALRFINFSIVFLCNPVT